MKLIRSVWTIVFAGIGTLGTSPLANAQVLYGSVVGALVDQSGAAVPGGAVKLVSTESGLVRETVADSEGRYAIANVVAGTYTLTVAAPGFRTITRQDIAVVINAVTRVDLKLEVGAMAESVTVSGAGAALQTDKADVHTDLNPEDLANLPLENYRNFQSLIDITPGATPGEQQGTITDQPQRSLSTNVNGVFRNSNNARVDGVANIFVSQPHLMAYVPPVEAIQTVNVTTSSFDAEQGLTAGAGITVYTKSGTNAFHVTAFWYHDNQHLRARNYFLGLSEKPRGTSNFPGGTFGGPIKKNKLFFFTSWEGTHERAAKVANLSVPTEALRAGDFSSVPVTLYDPATGNPNGTGRQPFAGNLIPAARQSAVAKRILDFIPMPNRSVALLTNYISAGTQKLDRNNYDAKVNWNRIDTHTVWAKYSRMDATVDCAYALGKGGGPGLCASGAGTADTVVNLVNFGHTWALRSNLLFDSTFGVTRLDTVGTTSDYGTNFGTEVWGIPNTNSSDIRTSGMPIIRTGYGDWGNSFPWLPMWRNDRSATLSANVSYLKGAHEFRFGYDLIRAHLNVWQPNVGASGPRGRIVFNGGETSLNGGAAPNYLNAFGSFMLGLPTTMGKAVQNYPRQTSREWQHGWYVRDRWRVSRSVIVNLGLRYEYYPLMTREDRGIERWDPYSNLVYLGGIGGNPNNVGIEVSKRLFAPRVGIAWRMTPKTVLRTGYGINIDPSSMARPMRSLYPSVVEATFAGPNQFTPVRPIELGIPAIPIPDISSGVITLPLQVSMSRSSVWGGMVTRGYVQSWNFTLERELPASLIATMAYVGTKVVNSRGDRDINTAPPGGGDANRPLARLYGRTVGSNMYDGWLSANYHSLQVSVSRSMRKGLMLKGAYTLSKAINFQDEGQWETPMWNWEPIVYRNRARAGYDRTHMLVAAAVYELPFGKGKPLLTSGAASKALRGWQVNTMFSSYTGTPFYVTASGASLNSTGNAQTADQVLPSVAKLGAIGPGEPFYDPNAFRPVTGARYGNSGRNILTGPGRVNVNLSVFRTFPIGEKMKLQFKTESFNFTNTPHFNNPSASTTSLSLNSDGSIRTFGNFMAVTSARSDERQFRFGLRLSF